MWPLIGLLSKISLFSHQSSGKDGLSTIDICSQSTLRKIIFVRFWSIYVVLGAWYFSCFLVPGKRNRGYALVLTYFSNRDPSFIARDLFWENCLSSFFWQTYIQTNIHLEWGEIIGLIPLGVTKYIWKYIDMMRYFSSTVFQCYVGLQTVQKR